MVQQIWQGGEGGENDEQYCGYTKHPQDPRTVCRAVPSVGEALRASVSSIQLSFLHVRDDSPRMRFYACTAPESTESSLMLGAPASLHPLNTPRRNVDARRGIIPSCRWSSERESSPATM